MRDNWKVWDKEKEYGNILFERATKLLPEMENSKAVAKIVYDIIRDNDVIVDIARSAYSS